MASGRPLPCCSRARAGGVAAGVGLVGHAIPRGTAVHGAGGPGRCAGARSEQRSGVPRGDGATGGVVPSRGECAGLRDEDGDGDARPRAHVPSHGAVAASPALHRGGGPDERSGAPSERRPVVPGRDGTAGGVVRSRGECIGSRDEDRVWRTAPRRRYIGWSCRRLASLSRCR